MLFGRRRSVSRGQASGWRRRASRGVFEVDCLVEPGAEEVVYPRSRRSLDRMRTPVWKLPGYGIMPARVDQFAGKAIHNGLKLANMNTCREPNRMPDQRLTNSSRTTNHARARGSICRKSHPQRAQTGEYEYLSRAKPHARSKAYEFFTDDSTRQST